MVSADAGNQKITEAVEAARWMRKQIVTMHAQAKSSHIGSCFSCVDIVAALYFCVLNIFPSEPQNPRRDRFILSKGHAASALYTALARRNLIPMQWWQEYAQEDCRFCGHVDRSALPFVEASTGSLGHGLPIGVGITYALKLAKNPARVFVLMSDGEIQEGSVWEAANAASRLKLGGLTGIIDANKIQSFERTDNIMPIASFKSKWEAFGWMVQEVDGHDMRQLVLALSAKPDEHKPLMVIAHTVKGKGVKEFEGQIGWHYFSPKPQNVQKYLDELDEKSVC